MTDDFKKTQTHYAQLWALSEKNLTSKLSIEDLRTAGLCAAYLSKWPSALIRLEEALQWGLCDFQLLDAFGEAVYQTRSFELILPFQEKYTDSRVSIHFARALYFLGDKTKAADFLQLSEKTMLSKALGQLVHLPNTIEAATQIFDQTNLTEFEKLNFTEYWQAVAPFSDVSGQQKNVLIAERKLKALAYKKPTTHFNQALRFLHHQEFSAGWKLYDHRLAPDSPCSQPTRFLSIEFWEGQKLNENSKILIHLENGWGDQIFSLRFVKELQMKTNAKIDFYVKPEMKNLIQSSFKNSTVYDIADNNIENIKSENYDYWTYAFSIPARFYLAEPLQTNGYLKTTSKSVDKITNTKYIAITWHGDIRTAPMRTRAYSLTEFLDYLQKNILQTNQPYAFLPLQTEITNDEKNELQYFCDQNNSQYLDISDDLTDFEITAVYLQSADYIFSCDTAVGHLAGALGLKSTVLIRNTSIWHWVKNENNKSVWNQSVIVKNYLNPKLSYMFEF